jgi:hypothetical protein
MYPRISKWLAYLSPLLLTANFVARVWADPVNGLPLPSAAAGVAAGAKTAQQTFDSLFEQYWSFSRSENPNDEINGRMQGLLQGGVHVTQQQLTTLYRQQDVPLNLFQNAIDSLNPNQKSLFQLEEDDFLYVTNDNLDKLGALIQSGLLKDQIPLIEKDLGTLEQDQKSYLEAVKNKYPANITDFDFTLLGEAIFNSEAPGTRDVIIPPVSRTFWVGGEPVIITYQRERLNIPLIQAILGDDTRSESVTSGLKTRLGKISDILSLLSPPKPSVGPGNPQP